MERFYIRDNKREAMNYLKENGYEQIRLEINGEWVYVPKTYINRDGNTARYNGKDLIVTKYDRKSLTWKGYRLIKLLGKTYTHHRVVAWRFVDNPNGYKEIDHINGIKHDNRAENLEWVTHSENMKRFYMNGKYEMPVDKEIAIREHEKWAKIMKNLIGAEA